MKYEKGFRSFVEKISVWLIFVAEGTNTLVFFVFQYGVESGAACSAESGAKHYFIKIGVFKIFTIITRKHLCQSHFLIKLQT